MECDGTIPQPPSCALRSSVPPACTAEVPVAAASEPAGATPEGHLDARHSNAYNGSHILGRQPFTRMATPTTL